MAAQLMLRFKKGTDGSVVLTLTRPDETTAWQRQQGPKALFFARHDLTHYAVETMLGYRHGFYGLMADGWEFTDFAPPWPRGRIPAEPGLAELIVGFFDAEQSSPTPWSAEQFNEFAARYLAQQGAAVRPPVLTDDELARIRASQRELLDRWGAVPPGGTLELAFDLLPRAVAR